MDGTAFRAPPRQMQGGANGSIQPQIIFAVPKPFGLKEVLGTAIAAQET